ncbi:MAG: hypothetical protein JKY65_06775 [Planctomycetes bacterium]|nr:hypothetical protein [Planctomycetota bacterium]
MRISFLTSTFLLAGTCFLFGASPAFAGPDAPQATPGKAVAKPVGKAVAPAKKLAKEMVREDRTARPAHDTVRTSWPKALKHRVSRYARFDRVLDREGDLSEEIRAAMVRTRVQDVRGDRLELARAKLSKRQRYASRNAVLARQRGVESDLRERQLSRLTRARSQADFRRQVVIPSEEMAELAKYKEGLKRWGNPLSPERLRMADKARNERGVDAEIRTKDRRKGRERTDRGRYLGRLHTGEQSERDEENAAERRAEKDEADEENAAERRAEKDEADEENAAERRAEKDEADEENATERDAEKDEADEERAAERADEKSIRQAEENTSDD